MKAAFEISKGTRTILTLSEAQVQACLQPLELLDALEEGFRQLQRDHVQSPARPQITIPDQGFSLTMSAWCEGMPIAVKIVNVFEANLAIDMPSHLAMITLFDPANGATLCVMDGTYITAVRTTAAAMLSIRMLARSNAKVATIIGAGVQAREHLRLLPLVRDLKQIYIGSLYREQAEQLAKHDPRAQAVIDIQSAVERSDIVCLATHSATPVIDATWIKSGTHVSSVGYHPPVGELPSELAANARLFVETLDAFEPTPVGCAELADIDPKRGITLGAVLLGQTAGRQHSEEITVYKAMGVAMEDLFAANLAYQNALRQGIGGNMAW